MGVINSKGAEIYKYMNFNEMEAFNKAADSVKA
jgi:aconitase B